MKLPPAIAFFLKEKMTVAVACLPQKYPEAERFLFFQKGYRVHAISGDILTGDQPGDFQPDWFVICTNEFDDPFFVDFTEEEKDFPVYFALHGAGKWEHLLIADTITKFTSLLISLQHLQHDKERSLSFAKENTDLSNSFWKEVYTSIAERETNDLITLPGNESAWIKGKVVITNLGNNRMRVINHLKEKLKLTPQQALHLSKGEEIEYSTGYLVHIKREMELLKKMGAGCIFIADEA